MENELNGFCYKEVDIESGISILIPEPFPKLDNLGGEPRFIIPLIVVETAEVDEWNVGIPTKLVFKCIAVRLVGGITDGCHHEWGAIEIEYRRDPFETEPGQEYDANVFRCATSGEVDWLEWVDLPKGKWRCNVFIAGSEWVGWVRVHYEAFDPHHPRVRELDKRGILVPQSIQGFLDASNSSW